MRCLRSATTAFTATPKFSTPSPSGAADNGSAFAGLNSNTPWFNLAIAAVIFIGRYPPIIFLMGGRGFGRTQADDAADDEHASHRHGDVRRVLVCDHPDRRCADLLPGPGSRTNRRILRHEGWTHFLMSRRTASAGDNNGTANRKQHEAVEPLGATFRGVQLARRLIPLDLFLQALTNSLAQIRSARADPQSGHVRRLGRHAGDAGLDHPAGFVRSVRAPRASITASSPWCWR